MVLVIKKTEVVDDGFIKPYAENPRYWQYKGKPVLLLGGSDEDNLFQTPDLEAFLNKLDKVGGNLVRNVMSARDIGEFDTSLGIVDQEDSASVEISNVQAFLQLQDGRYDLNKWNPEYWNRFENFLKLCNDRGIIVQIEIWDRFDYSNIYWQNSPYNPKNNINYDSITSGLKIDYPEHPHKDLQPFFHSVPGMDDYRPRLDLLRSYQEQYVEKLLSHSLKYENVLYCMNNETSTPKDWGKYWIDFIEAKAGENDVDVYVTDMIDHFFRPHSCQRCQELIQDPEVYSFVDISQINSRNFDENHWDTLQWIVKLRDQNLLRPLNHTKVYGGDMTSWGSGSNADGVERFCRNIIGGSAAARHSRSKRGNGLNEKSEASIKAIRKIESLVKLWDVAPEMELLGNRTEDEAYLTTKEGEKYIIYFTQGGDITLDLTEYNTDFKISWIDISTGSWGDKSTIQGGEVVGISAPGNKGWFAVITK